MGHEMRQKGAERLATGADRFIPRTFQQIGVANRGGMICKIQQNQNLLLLF